MGWASGGDIFEAVVDELIATRADEATIGRVTRVLIEKLVERGWDTEEESIGRYDHPGVLRAANELGYHAYHQIPEDGSYSQARIRCRACRNRVTYRRDEEGEVRSEIHAVVFGATMRGPGLCPFSNKNPHGY